MDDHTENDVLKRALARRETLEREIQKLDIFLSVYKEICGGELAVAPESVPVTEGTVPPDASTPMVQIYKEPNVRPASGMSQIDFADFVEEILLENGRPMLPEALFSEIHNRGRHVGGAKEWENFRTKLWRAKQDGRLVIIPGAGNWPAQKPCPAVSYTPIGSGEDADANLLSGNSKLPSDQA